jgi:hypothetical protein
MIMAMDLLEEAMKKDPRTRCEELLAALQAKYPQVGLTFGYIGNDDARWGDDRSWMFFTKIPYSDGSGTYSFGRYGTQELGLLIDRAEVELENWIVARVIPCVKVGR